MHMSLLSGLALVVCAACGGSGGTSAVTPPPAPPPPPPATAPVALFAPGIAFDDARGRLVVFGGEGDARALPAETWEWDGSAWSRRAATGPSGRFWGAMAYDATRRRIVLFGGASASATLGDTWEYDGTQWRQLAVAGPPARYAHEMVFDPDRGRIVLHGGRGVAGALGDVWTWDGTAWREETATGAAPPARFAGALAYDRTRRTLVSFGGHGVPAGAAVGSATQSLGDGWSYATQRWTEHGGARPSARDHVSMAYDAARGRVVLYGGVASPAGTATTPTSLFDTWEWDGTAWRVAATTGPDPRGNHRLAYDGVRGRVLLWTGAPSGTATEIWAWDGTRWARVP